MGLSSGARQSTDRKLSDGFTVIHTVVDTPAEAAVVIVLPGCQCKLSLGTGKIPVDGSLKLSLGACGAQRCVSRRTMLRSFLMHNHSNSSTSEQAALLVFYGGRQSMSQSRKCITCSSADAVGCETADAAASSSSMRLLRRS